MWCIWLKDGNKWIQSTKTWVEESDARTAAASLKSMFSMDQVFIQFSDDPTEEIL